MFGFQRVGDFAWAGADSQSRGFLIGATAGRTTLAGEGLQHQDGHSHLLASTIPNCLSYDPTFHYELAVIFREGLRRMHEKKENIFYYITTMNENYPHPAIPKDKSCEEGILKGMYKIKEFNKNKKTKITSNKINALGYDLTFCIKKNSKNYLASLKNKKTNIQLDFYSNLPGVQLYTSQGLRYKNKLTPYQGVCLETQHYPDAPNNKNFPSTLIKPKKLYKCFTKINIS